MGEVGAPILSENGDKLSQLLFTLKENDIVDILDNNDVYCPAKVLQIRRKEGILVRYIGWDDAWNEVITDMSRIEEKETFVSRYKCWVLLSEKIPIWPCTMFVRMPKPGSIKGVSYLRMESKVFIVPCGPNKNPIHIYKHGVWFSPSNITPFHDIAEEKHVEFGLSSKYEVIFQEALNEIYTSNAKDSMFKFDGTYEIINRNFDVIDEGVLNLKEMKKTSNGRKKQRISLDDPKQEPNSTETGLTTASTVYPLSIARKRMDAYSRSNCTVSRTAARVIRAHLQTLHNGAEEENIFLRSFQITEDVRRAGVWSAAVSKDTVTIAEPRIETAVNHDANRAPHAAVETETLPSDSQGVSAAQAEIYSPQPSLEAAAIASTEVPAPPESNCGALKDATSESVGWNIRKFFNVLAFRASVTQDGSSTRKAEQPIAAKVVDAETQTSNWQNMRKQPQPTKNKRRAS